MRTDELFADTSSCNSIHNLYQEGQPSQKLNSCHQVEQDIFNYLNLNFKVNEIRINQEQTLHTICLESENPQNRNRCYYLTHGFGGSSLMFFPIVKMLLKSGSVVLWELRGMGFSKKLGKYNCPPQEIPRFFSEPIGLMLNFYKHQKINLIGHSLGAYSILNYLLLYSRMCNNENNHNPENLIASRIEEVVLLSPVGLTSKEKDYKSKINSFSSLLHYIGNQISWHFGLTYKSPFRKLFRCFRDKVFSNAVKDTGMDDAEQQLMKQLIIGLVDSSDGSENLFFKLFEPRVVPKYPIEPIFKKHPLNKKINMRAYYGNEEDWVDRQGAETLHARFPDNFYYETGVNCTHNFPFFPKVLMQLLTPIFELSTKASSSEKVNVNYEQEKEG